MTKSTRTTLRRDLVIWSEHSRTDAARSAVPFDSQRCKARPKVRAKYGVQFLPLSATNPIRVDNTFHTHVWQNRVRKVK